MKTRPALPAKDDDARRLEALADELAGFYEDGVRVKVQF